MNSKMDITYREMQASPSLDFCLNEQIEKAERHWPSLESCRVVITAPTAKHTNGGHFHVTVELKVPGSGAFADRDPDQNFSHEDCQSAIRDAFRAALKELDRDRDRKNKLTRHPRDATP